MMRWVHHVACMMEMRKSVQILVGKPEEYNLEEYSELSKILPFFKTRSEFLFTDFNMLNNGSEEHSPGRPCVKILLSVF